MVELGAEEACSFHESQQKEGGKKGGKEVN